MQRPLLLGLLALAAGLAVAGWLLLDRGGTQTVGVGELDAAGPDRPPPPVVRERVTSPAASRQADSQPIIARAYADAEAGAPPEPVSLRVLVVDGTGFPVPGAEVAWRNKRDGDVSISLFAPKYGSAAFERAPHKAVADERGIGVIEGVASGTIVYARKGELAGARSFSAIPRGEIRVALRDTATMGHDSPENDPTPFQGRVILKLVDPDGRPLREPARATLESERVQFWLQSDSNPDTGVIEFRQAPADVPLSARVSCESFDTTPAQLGRVRQNGELVAEVRFERRKAWVSGRALDEAGRPIAEKTLDVDVLSPDGYPRLEKAARTRTGKDGVFRQAIDRSLVDGRGCELALAKCPEPRVVEKMAFVDLPAGLPAGEISLGDVRLAAPEAMAFGTVVDDVGNPLPGALVSARISASRVTLVMGGRMSIFWGEQAASDASGNFLIPLPRRLRGETFSFDASAELEGYVCSTPPMYRRPALTPVKLVLQATGGMSGSLRLPEMAPVGKLQIRVERTSPVPEDGTNVWRFEDCVDSDGAFVLTGILPGKATVSVQLGFGKSLAEIRGVVVPRGAMADDRRLAAIDLRDHPALQRR